MSAKCLRVVRRPNLPTTVYRVLRLEFLKFRNKCLNWENDETVSKCIFLNFVLIYKSYIWFHTSISSGTLYCKCIYIDSKNSKNIVRINAWFSKSIFYLVYVQFGIPIKHNDGTNKSILPISTATGVIRISNGYIAFGIFI